MPKVIFLVVISQSTSFYCFFNGFFLHISNTATLNGLYVILSFLKSKSLFEHFRYAKLNPKKVENEPSFIQKIAR